jgi:hypothetical protein
MTINHERRSKLVGFTIRQHSWELETLQDRNRRMAVALAQINEELRQIEMVIQQTESRIRRTLAGESSMDLVALQTARQFLAELQEHRRGKTLEQQRTAQRARKAEIQLKEATLYVKALKQIKATSDKEVWAAQEKKMAEQNAELWLQRQGRKRWQTNR